MASQRWTPAELSALNKAYSYQEWVDLVGGPTKTYDAWEVKRRRVQQTDAGAWSPMRIQRAMTNNVKVARNMIRLRHSIEADDELALVLPRIREALEGQAQEGRVTGLSYDQLRSLIYGT